MVNVPVYCILKKGQSICIITAEALRTISYQLNYRCAAADRLPVNLETVLRFCFNNKVFRNAPEQLRIFDVQCECTCAGFFNRVRLFRVACNQFCP